MLKKMLSVVLALMLMMSVIIVPVAVSAEDAAPSPILQFIFNDNAVDSVNGYTATPARTIQYSTDSTFGRVLNLANAGYLTVPGAALPVEKLGGSFTFTMWTNVPSWQWSSYLFSMGKDRNNQFFFMPGRQYYNNGWGAGEAIIKGGTATYVEVPDTDSPWAGRGWWHVTLSLDAENQKLSYWLNGTKMAEKVCTATLADILDAEDSSKNYLYIGKGMSGSTLIDARLHDFRLYDSALTGAQIADVMAQAKTDEAALRNAIAGVDLGTLEGRTTNFTLPKTSMGAALTWESSDNALVDAETGVVTRPVFTNENETETAVLKVTAALKGMTGTK